MRKLRKDITLEEAVTWFEDRYDSYSPMYALAEDARTGEATMDYPDSFYEKPEIGSFGSFRDGNIGKPKWGFLTQIVKQNGCVGYRKDGGATYASFAPGLPQDVNPDGSPK